MNKKIRLATTLILSLIILSLHTFAAFELPQYGGKINARSAVLMEMSSGKILYSLNADTPYSPASVTKIMTVLLIVEAIENKQIAESDIVTVSDTASKMGGSQVYLKAGEEMSVGEMLKCVLVSSANDASVALAEKLCGSEDSFVAQMNARAKELGMTNAQFTNATGLDDDGGNLMSANDIAIASRELLKHEEIFKYTTIWMDSIRDGAFGLTNTNRLIRFYKGANGLKTGSTSKAGYCISATAKRDGMQLIAVIMGSETRDIRNDAAKALLDFGFSNFALHSTGAELLNDMPIYAANKQTLKIGVNSNSILTSKALSDKIERKINLTEDLKAPICAGDTVGTVDFIANGETVDSELILALEDADRIGFTGIFKKLFLKMLYV